jgi:DNA-binding response OmpR family regulator
VRVLVVDDDRSLLDLMVRSMLIWGWEVVGAASLAEAKAALGSWDAVVADVRLPNGDGRELEHHFLSVPLVVISGGNAPDADLRKPFSMQRLRDVVLTYAR